MQEDIFSVLGLDNNPFSVATNFYGYYHTDATKRILEELWHGIITRKGFLVLMGEVGVGKTSLALQLMDKCKKERIPYAWIFNTAFNKIELFQVIANSFKLKMEGNLVTLQKQFHNYLHKLYHKGNNCVIIIDEAHNLDSECLETLRMLTNLEHAGQKLVQILLIGQPELKLILEQPKMRQVRSRISIFLELPHLTKEELKGYIDFKLASAESQLRITRNAIGLLFEATQGNLRLVNLVMERALYALFAQNEHSLSKKIIKLAIEDVAIYQTDISRHLRKIKNKKLISSFVISIFVICLCYSGIEILYFNHAPSSFFITKTVSSYISQIRYNKTNDASCQNTYRGPIPPKNLKNTGPVRSLNSITKHSNATNSSIIAASETQQEIKAIPAAWHKFLAPWGEEDLLPWLKLAVKYQCEELLARHLPEKLQLLKLSSLPDKTRGNWSALLWRQYVHDGPEWIVIWRPFIKVEAFYYKVISADIAIIQTILSKLGYNPGRVDGIAGHRTWVAISNFQKDMNLPITGYPDKNTIFWLEQKGAD
jgi:type II secretory pathway predicted ATPase ExeA